MAQRKTWRSVRLIVLLMTLQISIYAQDTLMKLYSEAQAAEKKGDYPVVIDRYQRILELAPEMAEAHAKLGAIYFTMGETDKAEIAFKSALKLNPKLWGPRFSLGVMAFEAREYDVALENLKRAELLDPSSVTTQLYLGYTEYARSQFLEAAEHFEQASSGDHPNVDAIYHLSKSYAQVATELFDLLQGRFQDSAYAHLARAHTYEVKKDWKNSQLEYKSALEKLPDNPRLQQKLEYISLKAAAEEGALVKDNPSDDLVDGFLKLQFVPPTGGNIVRELHRYQCQVVILTRKSDGTKSAKDFYLLVENYQSLSFLASLWLFDLQPDSYRAHQLKGQYYEALRQDLEAVTEYQRALELNSKLQNVHLSIGTIYWTKGNLDEALSEIQRELELNPNNPSALYIAGDILFSQNQMSQAQEYFLKSLKLEPHMIEARLGVARIYASEKEYEKALDQLQQVLKLEPENTMAHYRIAQAYEKLGRLEDSKREMEMFQRLKEKHPRRY